MYLNLRQPYVKVARECRVVRLRFSCLHYDHMRATELQRICSCRKAVEASEPQREDGVRTHWRHLTVKLNGRPEAQRARQSDSTLKAHQAPSHAEFRGPLQCLLEGLPLPPNKATQVTWHCLTARRRAAPTSNELD